MVRLSFEEDDDGSRYKLQDPWWWKEGTKPCDCKAKTEILNAHVGYSDFYYEQCRCTKCGKVFCWYLEG